MKRPTQLPQQIGTRLSNAQHEGFTALCDLECVQPQAILRSWIERAVLSRSLDPRDWPHAIATPGQQDRQTRRTKETIIGRSQSLEDFLNKQEDKQE